MYFMRMWRRTKNELELGTIYSRNVNLKDQDVNDILPIEMVACHATTWSFVF